MKVWNWHHTQLPKIYDRGATRPQEVVKVGTMNQKQRCVMGVELPIQKVRLSTITHDQMCYGGGSRPKEIVRIGIIAHK